MGAKIISICNQKGGVAKTTTTLNMGVGLAREGYKVLLIDTDQGDLTAALGWYGTDEMEYTLSHCIESFIENKPFDVRDYIIKHSEGVDLIPSDIGISFSEMRMIAAMMREKIIKNIIEPIKNDYDYILMDCPPSLGMLTINALTASDSVLIPVMPQYLSTRGMQQLLTTINNVHRFSNPDLKIEGIVITIKDNRTKDSKENAIFVRENYGQYINVFDVEIPIETKAAESTKHAVSVFSYNPAGKATAAYRDLVSEVIRNDEERRFTGRSSIKEAGTDASGVQSVLDSRDAGY